MILESIVTTLNSDDSVNLSPMGPTIHHNGTDSAIKQFELRPFPSSQTFTNLKRTRQGVLHITDDVELFARAAIGQLTVLPDLTPAKIIDGNAIADSCRWYEFQVDDIDESRQRMRLNCRVVHAHRERDFFGFNRAKHAVLEAAILATRLDFLPRQTIENQFRHLETMVTKTGGPIEHRAFELLKSFVFSKNEH